MLFSFNPGNNIYNCINSYQRKSIVENNITNRKILLPNIKSIKEKIILNNLDNSKYNNSLKNINKNSKIKIIKSIYNNIPYKKLCKINITSNLLNNDNSNKDDFKIKEVFKHSIKKIRLKNKNKLVNSQSCQNILTNNILSLMNSSNNIDNNSSKVTLKKSSSLPVLKNIPNKINENNNCNYIFLEYKGKNNINGNNKKTYIQINPHKLIEQLKTISMPFDVYGIKLFSLVNKIINKKSYKSNYSPENSFTNKNKTKNNITLNNSHTVYDIQMLEGIYDQYLLPDKNNKYSFFITKIFFTDVMNKVFKKMFEIRDRHNKIITLGEIKEEYKSQLNKLKLFLEYKTMNNNNHNNKNEMKIMEALGLIQNNKNAQEKIINKKDIKQNLSYNNDKVNNSHNYGNFKYSKINLNNSLILGPITERKFLDNSKIVDNLFSHNTNRLLNRNNISNNENNYNKEDISSYTFGPKINFVNFEDIYKEIQAIYEENNIRKKTNKNMDSIFNLILSEKDTYKKLKFDNDLIEKFIKIYREQNKNRNIDPSNKHIIHGLHEIHETEKNENNINNNYPSLNNVYDLNIKKKGKRKYETIKIKSKEKNYKNLIIYEEVKNYINEIRNEINQDFYNIKKNKKRNKSGQSTKKAFIIKDIMFDLEKLFMIQNINNNCIDIDHKRFITELNNQRKDNKIYIKHLKANKKENISSISTSINNNNIYGIKEANTISDNQIDEYSKLIFSLTNNNNSNNNYTERINSSKKIKNKIKNPKKDIIQEVKKKILDNKNLNKLLNEKLQNKIIRKRIINQYNEINNAKKDLIDNKNNIETNRIEINHNLKLNKNKEPILINTNNMDKNLTQKKDNSYIKQNNNNINNKKEVNIKERKIKIKIKNNLLNKKDKKLKSIYKHSSSKSIPFDLNDSSINNDSFISYSSLSIPDNLNIKMNTSHKYEKEKNILNNFDKYYKKYKTFYINKRNNKNKKIVKKYKTSPNINSLNLSQLFKDNNITDINDNINDANKIEINYLDNELKKHLSQEDIININLNNNNQTIQSSSKNNNLILNDSTFNEDINMSNISIIELKLSKSVDNYFKKPKNKNNKNNSNINNNTNSYYNSNNSNTNSYDSNIDNNSNDNRQNDDSYLDLNRMDISKSLRIKNKKIFIKKRRNTEIRFKDFIKSDNEKIIRIDLEKKLKNLKKKVIEYHEKNKKDWEAKFKMFKEYIKNLKNSSFNDFLEFNDANKEMERLNFEIKIKNVQRINVFKRFIKNYKNKMKNLSKSYSHKIIFRHPCIFKSGIPYK